MPRGIRLVVQKAEKVPFQPGQLAAQVWDRGKYKAWYTIAPCDAPEPFSSKKQILPGYNAHICYAESEDAVTWQGAHELNHDGDPVILRFQLRQAQLFGVEFY